ncbi:cysteine-rich RLK (RECEPTOR-like protein kinase) 8 [Striga hermonthica]|uniref:Cysteine-rich RLK (RECEPTOR-like protein kinase) 8 n=1 Tax=Striga hermonthica TaxID=68872 RepID=A0A9N7NBH8_STRHE|nr:cysteine-rich RLK (RECEPTOR-like protein kinase) 8 [Striga hermonthica]
MSLNDLNSRGESEDCTELEATLTGVKQLSLSDPKEDPSVKETTQAQSLTDTQRDTNQELPKELRIRKEHPQENIIDQVENRVMARGQLSKMIGNVAFVSMLEPKVFTDAEHDEYWMNAMQEELDQFKRNQSNPKESHLTAVKRILRYLHSSVEAGIWYPASENFELHGYTDADYGGDRLERKSTSGGYQFLGERLVSWFSKKQASVALSTTEAEYIAAGSCVAQVLWIKQQIEDYGIQIKTIEVKCDKK